MTITPIWEWKCDTCNAAPVSFESEQNARNWADLHPQLREHRPVEGSPS